MNPADKSVARRPALGRGLSALVPAAETARPAQAPSGPAVTGPIAGAAHAQAQLQSGPPRAQIFQLAIEDIHRDEHQPRRHFDPAKLTELAESIKSKGIIQPVLVRKSGQKQGAYKIIAGERRWRAAQLAGLKEIPAIIKEASEHEAFELALVENLQRQDLNPIEEAEGYRRLLEEHHLTQEMVAQRVGKDRSTVANALRLLQLPEDIKESLVEGSLNMGHARALLGVASEKQMKQAAAEVIKSKLSVRATEGLVRKLKEGHSPKKEEPKGETAATRDLTERLQRALGTKCRIVDSGGKGRIEVEFSSYEDLDRLLEKMMGEKLKGHR